MLQRFPDGFLRWISSLDNAHTVSICVVARIGTHGFSLVRSMGTQNSRGVVLLAILAKRLEILAVHTVFEPGLVNKDNHVGVFVPITICLLYTSDAADE